MRSPSNTGAPPFSGTSSSVSRTAYIHFAQGHASGRYELSTSGGVASVTRTDRPADVGVTAETLASLYLGEVEVRRMHHAGRVEGASDAVARLGAMADLSDPPYSLTGF